MPELAQGVILIAQVVVNLIAPVGNEASEFALGLGVLFSPTADDAGEAPKRPHDKP